MTSIKTTSRIAAISLALAAGLLAMAPEAVFAQTNGIWSATTGGSWGTDTNWTGLQIAGGVSGSANFASSISGIQVVTLDGDRTIGAIRLGGPTSASIFSLQIGTSGTLTLATNSGSPILDLQSSRSGIIGASLAGTQGFVKNGSGTLYLGGTSTYSGTTTANLGTLELTTPNSFGASGAGNETVVLGNAPARVRIGGTTSTAESFIISGTGVSNVGAINFGSSQTPTVNTTGTITGQITLSAAAQIGAAGGSSGVLDRSGAGDAIQTNGFQVSFTGAGTLRVNSPIAGTGGALAHGGTGVVTLTAANTYTGTTAITGNGSLRLGAGGTDGSLSTSSAISMAAAQSTFVVDQSDTVTQGVDFSGAAITASVGGPGIGNFIQAGSGTTILNAANSYRGATSVNAGTLLVNGDQSGATGAVTVASGATLGGSGTTGGAVSILGGAIVAPGSGSGVGTLTVSNAFTLANSSILNFELNPLDNTVGGGINDLITGVSNLTLDGVLNVPDAGGWTSVADFTTWRLFNYAGTLTNNLLALGTMPTLGSGQSFQIDTSTSGQVNLIVVPEPSTLVLLSGLVVVGFFARRQRGGRG